MISMCGYDRYERSHSFHISYMFLSSHRVRPERLGFRKNRPPNPARPIESGRHSAKNSILWLTSWLRTDFPRSFRRSLAADARSGGIDSFPKTGTLTATQSASRNLPHPEVPMVVPGNHEVRLPQRRLTGMTVRLTNGERTENDEIFQTGSDSSQSQWSLPASRFGS